MSDSLRLWAVTPIDGRYGSQTQALGSFLSEGALITQRTRVEAAWLLHLDAESGVECALEGNTKSFLKDVFAGEVAVDVAAIKSIEKTTNHDVKAVEYWLREKLQELGASEQVMSHIHFACTSEDINNTAYGLMLSGLREGCFLPQMDLVISQINEIVRAHGATPMLSRTHGQTASPSTLGKEFAVFSHRLSRHRHAFAEVTLECKMSGAVGNYNAHLVAYPNVDWPRVAKDFIESRLGLKQNVLTTQIENHDTVAEYLHAVNRFNAVMLDLCRDVWGYISVGYFGQKVKAGEVGSSTMPHKVNPIDFENAEGNIGIANSLGSHLAEKLLCSRWQRDLSDSTALRALGSWAGHSFLALKSLEKGLNKLTVREDRLTADLENSWEVLAEPIQTVMRRYGVVDAYERLKEATRGRAIGKSDLAALVNSCAEIPPHEKQRLLELTPHSYVGEAAELAKKVL